jgi:hypothetical protein
MVRRGFFICCTLRVMKQRTFQQVQIAKQKAESFVREVLGNESRAGEIAAESVEDYAERKRVTIKNPTVKERAMASKRERELEAVKTFQGEMIEQLEEELDTLRAAVRSTAALVPDDDDDEEDSEDGDSDDDEEEN